MKVGIIIQARMLSSRLKGKSLMNLCGVPLIEHVIRSASAVKYSDVVVVATSRDPSCDEFADFLATFPLEIFRGDELDVLSRYLQIIDSYSLTHVVRITGDDPCHDPDLIDRSLEFFLENSLNYLISGFPGKSIPDGMVYEIISKEAFGMLSSLELSDPTIREHVTTHFRSRVGNDPSFTFMPHHLIPEICLVASNVSLCVDTYDDLLKLQRNWIQRTLIDGTLLPNPYAMLDKMSNH